MSEKITLVAAKCQYCEKEIVGPKNSFDEVWDNHLDNCAEFKSYMALLEELHEKDLLQPTLKILRVEQVEKSLKRLIKKYKISPDELIEILETLPTSGGNY